MQVSPNLGGKGAAICARIIEGKRARAGEVARPDGTGESVPALGGGGEEILISISLFSWPAEREREVKALGSSPMAAAVIWSGGDEEEGGGHPKKWALEPN